MITVAKPQVTSVKGNLSWPAKKTNRSFREVIKEGHEMQSSSIMEASKFRVR